MQAVILTTEKIGEGGIASFCSTLESHARLISPRYGRQKTGLHLIVRYLEVLGRYFIFRMMNHQIKTVLVNEELLAVLIAIVDIKADIVSIIHGPRFWEKKSGVQRLLWDSFCHKLKKIVLVPGLEKAIRSKLSHTNITVLRDEPIRFNASVCKKRTIKRFVYVGRLVAWKAVENSINVVRDLNESGYLCSIDIYGEGPDYFRLLELSSNLPFVKLHGALEYSTVASTIRKYDCFIHLPDGLESYGLAPREALCLGLPLVTNYNGGLAPLATLPQVYMLRRNSGEKNFKAIDKDFITWLETPGNFPKYSSNFSLAELF